jgi:D-alanyl-D-alanine carboxypeptidase
MKKLLITTAAALMFMACTKTNMLFQPKDQDKQHTSTRIKGDSLQRILTKYTAKGIPGAVITLKDAQGEWQGAAGFSNLENRVPMMPTQLQYGFSITKVFTSVIVMQLKEQGRIDLDQPIKTYLPEAQHDLVPQTNKVTVRMLLNQTSGFNDYVRLDEFQQRWLSDPMKIWTRADYYDIIRRKVKNQFTPGTDFLYSNVNYYLLSLIIDHITGRPHGEWMQQNIIDKLGLKQTYYKHSLSYPFYASLPDCYWPRYPDGVIANITAAQQVWMQSEEYGTTGIIASPADYISFLKKLVEGKLVNAQSLVDMKTWVQGKESMEPDYGLGLTYWGYKGKIQYGHDGDGIGATAQLTYFPSNNTFVFIAANATTEMGGDMQKNIAEFRNEVCNFLAGF